MYSTIKIMINSAAGEIVEIYNSVGQRVVNTIERKD
jgi:hypothetical protein